MCYASRGTHCCYNYALTGNEHNFEFITRFSHKENVYTYETVAAFLLFQSCSLGLKRVILVSSVLHWFGVCYLGLECVLLV